MKCDKLKCPFITEDICQSRIIKSYGIAQKEKCGRYWASCDNCGELKKDCMCE